MEYNKFWMYGLLRWKPSFHEEVDKFIEAVKNHAMTLTQNKDSVDVLPPRACHGGTRSSMFGLRRMLNSMVNARNSRFILVQALDRRSSNDPTSSRRLPLRWIDYEVLCCTIVVLSQEPCPPLYSQEARVLVGLQ